MPENNPKAHKNRNSFPSSFVHHFNITHDPNYRVQTSGPPSHQDCRANPIFSIILKIRLTNSMSKTENSIVGDAKIATQSIQDEIHKLKDTHQ